jgi:hypothetical protein
MLSSDFVSKAFALSTVSQKPNQNMVAKTVKES